MFSTRFRPADAAVPVLLLAAALLIALIPARAGAADKVVVTYLEADNNLYSKAYGLGSDSDFTVTGKDGIELSVSIRGGTVRVTEAGCPGRDCVKTGEISRPGQSIVCLPAGILIRIEGSGSSRGGSDGIAG
jgi:hypothetical protein